MTNQVQTATVENLPVIAYQEVRVLTTELLATLYGTDPKNIRMNFSNNEDRFVSGKHYFKLEGDSLREFKNFHKANEIGSVEISPRTKHLTLWTERGAARHAKMLETDQAWDVFERLEDAYFGQKITPPAIKTSKTKVLPGGLTADQQAIIKELVLARAETLPQEQQAKAIITCWSALKSKFGCTYKAIPSAQFTDAVSLVARLPLEDTRVPVAQPGNPTQRWVLHFVNGVPRLDNAQGSYVLPASHFPSAIIGDEFPVDLLPSLIENAAKRLKKAE